MHHQWLDTAFETTVKYDRPVNIKCPADAMKLGSSNLTQALASWKVVKGIKDQARHGIVVGPAMRLQTREGGQKNVRMEE